MLSNPFAIFFYLTNNGYITLVSTKNYSKLNRFWNELKKAQGGNFIHLRKEVYLLGDALLGSTIFVRQCYSDFVKMIFVDNNVRGWCITGNSGVGKSFFTYYLLYLLAQQ